ncbi:uncharacterized protein LOC135836796 [Planococcus citri]|uniref:uncharacterized protein LOC135836796 n=1 Tax=Planococcus citri TaxID=170843 RepID=UPI0031FA410B
MWNLLLILTLIITLTKSEDKWVWSKERKVQSDATRITVAKPILNDVDVDSPRRKIDEELSRLLSTSNDDYRKARYEVQEQSDYVNGRPLKPRPFLENRPRPIPALPDRPLSDRDFPRPSPDRDFPRPSPDRDPLDLPDRPDDFLSLSSGPSPIRRQPPGGQSVGILTGPIPSWEKPVLHKNGDPTNFEHCKCSFSFNCKSPGIQFGSCDQGKQYCCYNEFESTKGPSGPNSGFGTNIDRGDGLPPVLVGPGGPTGINNKPILPPPPRPHNYRPLLPPPPYEDVEGLETLEFNDRRPYPLIPQKPVLPPYMGLHNDHRSSK